MKNYHLVQLLVMVFLVSIIVQNGFLIIKTTNMERSLIAGKAVTDASASICINSPPVITGHDCPTTLEESRVYTCKVNTTDPNNDNINITIEAPDENYTFFWTTFDGNVTIHTYIGNDTSNYTSLIAWHTIWFVATDDTGCSNNMGTPISHQFMINDQNDPPVLIKNIPDAAISLNTQTVIVKLSNYFMDPDPGDELSYSNTNISSIILSIMPNSDVIAYTTSCTSEDVVFTAEDPYNLSTSSNSVNVMAACASGDEGSSDSDETAGGGGGRSGFIPSCISEWICDKSWSECSSDGIQSKKCIDFAACDSDNTIYWLYKNCTYHRECEENWKCEEWGPCQPDNFQRRECEELSNCRTEEFKPEIIMPCKYIATCTDGIQNQGETGVDCGGPCLPCREIEVPGILQTQKKLISSIMVLLAFLILSLLLIYKYFHKEINLFIAKSLLSLILKIRKVIFLDEKKAKDLMEQLVYIEKHLNNKNIRQSMVKTAYVGREYLAGILKLPPTFDKDQLEKALEKTNLKNDLEKVFSSLFERMTRLESKKIKMYQSDVTTRTTEIKGLILMTSNYKLNNSEATVKEIEIEDKDSKIMRIKKETHNLYVAMMFNEIEVSKSKYTEILKLYENLTEKDKGVFFEDITRAFNELKYLISIQD